MPAGAAAPSGATMGGFSGMGSATPVPLGSQLTQNAGTKGAGLATIFWSMVLLGTALLILHNT